MSLTIMGFHGMTPVLKQKLLTLFPQARVSALSENKLFVDDMTLDQFYSKWADLFMVIPGSSPQSITIAVTLYSSFSSR